MKILFLFLSLSLSFTLYAQDSKKPELKCGDGQAKCSDFLIKPTFPKCADKCGGIVDVMKQKMCLKKCSDKPVKPMSCKKKCHFIKNPEKQKACLSSCIVKKLKKHKVSPELSSCEKSDSQTITCADGVYIKSSSVNDSEIIKEVHENQHKSDYHSSESSEQ